MSKDHIEIRIESDSFSCAHVQVIRLKGSEAISKPFCFDLDIVVVEPGRLDIDTMTGAEVDILFELSGEELRRVHGMITAVDDLLDTEPSHRSFRIRVSPRVCRLELVETQEIFMDLSVPEVIKQKLARLDLGDVDMRLMGTYPAREFITQYKETDLAFISRLSEHLGISFFFEQQGGLDHIVFTDHPVGFHKLEPDPTIPFVPRGERQAVYRFEAHKRVMPSVWAHQDYNYRIPRVDLTSMHEVEGVYGGGVVEYGAHYKTPDEGAALARARAEEREAICHYFTGESDVCTLAAGHIFTLIDHPRFDGNKELLVVEVTHEIVQVTHTHGGAGATRYSNTFRVVDAARTYRPPRVTPRPRINSVLTALVEPKDDGALGKVAEIDEQGRYTIRFYFDTSTVGERPRSSHRVRLIQHHVGPNYGTHLPLKAGIEVLVVFVDGDPDRPLIVGAAPNPVTRSPVTDFDPLMHRIKTASGILIQMKDHFKGR